MTGSLDPHNAREYRRRASGVELLAGLCITSGLVGLLRLDELGVSVVARQLGAVAQIVWLSLYLAGGALALAGLYWPRVPRPELEALGLWLLVGGFSINLLVLVAIRLPVPDGASLTTMSALVLAIRLAYRRVLDLERARVTERRAVDLGPRARGAARLTDRGRRRDGDK